MRGDVEIVYVTPLDGAFTKPVAAKHLGNILDEKNIILEPDFYLERVDTGAKKLISYDEREIEYDLLVSIPLNMGADVIQRSGLGNEMNYVPVDNGTFLSKDFDTYSLLVTQQTCSRPRQAPLHTSPWKSSRQTSCDMWRASRCARSSTDTRTASSSLVMARVGTMTSELERKLDLMSEQLDIVVAELREQRLRREQWGELISDLAPISGEAMAIGR